MHRIIPPGYGSHGWSGATPTDSAARRQMAAHFRWHPDRRTIRSRDVDMRSPTDRAHRRVVIILLLLMAAGCAQAAGGGALGLSAGAEEMVGYRVWVTSESADEVSLLHFDGDSLRIEQRVPVGSMPVEIDGPHGVAAAPDGAFIYVTTAHGTPAGSLWKVDARSREIVARTLLGPFPATVAVTPDGETAFVSNFNLHGDHVPSSISRVHLPTMTEISRTVTCVMPHGSRVNPQGTRHYSVCMMDEVLVEIDVATGDVTRRFSVTPGMERPVSLSDIEREHRLGEDAEGSGDGADPLLHTTMPTPGCSPTWAEPSADGSRVYVTCNRSDEVLEIDARSWSISRRFATGDAPYNLATTPDGRFLLVSLRSRTEPALEVHDLSNGQRVARIATTTTLAHGIAITSDSRYAFVSVEGVGSEPGRVDVFDLLAGRRVTSAPVASQATGIATAH